MMKLTDDIKKEFWEWCGLCIHEWDKEGYGLIGDTTCKKCGRSNIEYLDDSGKIWVEIPEIEDSITLDNLVKHALPKLYLTIGEEKTIKLLQEWVSEIILHLNTIDPALALFWVIWEVIHDEHG